MKKTERASVSFDGMFPSADACPSENDVAELVAGILSEARRARLERHLDRCCACRVLIAALMASTRAVSQATRPCEPAYSPWPKPGYALGRYVIRSLLGRGGMGAVYRAEDTVLRRDVALKLLPKRRSGAEAAGRWRREIRAAAALTHPNIVAIYDVGDTLEYAYFTMELVEGQTLRHFIGARSVPLSRRLTWLQSIASALAAAHARGLVHRDVKPENVMVRADGTCKLLDFGLVRWLDPSAPRPSESFAATRDDVAVGTPAYMAPEQIRGRAVDGRSDQFAWGVLAYELITGQRPWVCRPGRYAITAEILLADPLPFPVRARSLDHVESAVMRALRKRPEERFATMEEVVTALHERCVPSRASQVARGPIAMGAAIAIALLCAGAPSLRAPMLPTALAVAPSSVAPVSPPIVPVPVESRPPAVAVQRAETPIVRATPSPSRPARVSSGGMRLKDLKPID